MPRNRQIVSIAPDSILSLLRGEIRIVSPIPMDATTRHAAIDPFNGNVLLILHSESFPDTEEGERLLEFPLRAESINV